MEETHEDELHTVEIESCAKENNVWHGLAGICKFARSLHQRMCVHSDKKIICIVEETDRDVIHGVFLLGSYLIINCEMNPEEVLYEFDSLVCSLCPYDKEFMPELISQLEISDFWDGIYQANLLGWVDKFDVDEYVHYDNPLEGDIHTIIPGVLVAFKGPRSLKDEQMYEDCNGLRTFAPAFFIEPFHDMNVTTVVRLNEREYADAEFEDRGVRCVSLEFDGPIPPPDVVIAFLHTMHTARGAVAVHCRSGLGRTGTLCALHLMLSHGFGAGEAIAWMRVTLPGSIAGEEHEHLRALQAMVAVLLQTHPPLTGFTVESASPQAVATSFDAADNCPAQEALLESLHDVNAARADSSAPSSTAAVASPAPGLHLLARGPPPIALAHRALLRIQQLDLASSCGGGRPRPESPVFGSLRGRWEAK